uniref:Zgc:174164 n=1 Tax=Cyprinus carpio TaxID=7962 RepID=A0A8C1LU03_CYPCA
LFRHYFSYIYLLLVVYAFIVQSTHQTSYGKKYDVMIYLYRYKALLTVSESKLNVDRHADSISYSVRIDGHEHILHLTKNIHFLSKDFIVLSHTGERETVIMLVVLFQELCHYQGHVEGYEDSLVALSTCEGCNHCTLCFKGIILIGNNSYGLERSLHSKTNEHLLYLLKDSQSEPFICGLANETSSSEDHSHYDDMSMFIRVGKYTKYVELVLVVDHQRVNGPVGLLDTYYKQLNIRIALIGLKIFDKENPFNVNGNPGKVLGRFVQWRKTELLSQLRHDVGQLIVKQEACIKTFLLSFMCTMFVFGCERRGATKFSDCSKKDFERLIQRGGRACLRNPPSQDNIISAPRCGNGILESGEECDCGTPQTVCGGTSPFCPADFYVMEGLPLFCMFEFMLFFFLCISGYSEAMKTDDKCFSHVNTLGNSFGNCGYSGSNPKPCECIFDSNYPPAGATMSVVKIEGNTIICMNADFNMGLDVPDPAYVETGSVCAPGKACLDFTRLNSSACTDQFHCHCNNGWAPPNYYSLRDGLLIFFLLVVSVLVVLIIILLYVFKRDSLNCCREHRPSKSQSLSYRSINHYPSKPANPADPSVTQPR